jgi:N-acetylmuramoyl-L-alanine amidase
MNTGLDNSRHTLPLYILILPFLVCFLLLSGCAQPSRYRVREKVSVSDYVDIDTFCRKHTFGYSFDTLDDIVRIYSEDRQLRILLHSPVGSVDGSVFYLKNKPFYSRGKIYLPRELDLVISRKELTSFRTTFAVKTIVIDPGHGGKDPGAISVSGLHEKTINLIVSKYLRDILVKEGFRVILTRERDVYLTLQERVNIAKKHNADLFVSIHANANRSRQVKGVEIYYLSPSRLKSSERAMALAKTGNFYGKDFPLDVKTILWDLLITKNHSISIELSDVLYFAFKNLGFNVKTPRKAPFYVLRFAYVPSVLVEMGYLSNYQEEKTLRKVYYQKQIAQAIAFGIRSLNKRYASGGKRDIRGGPGA